MKKILSLLLMTAMLSCMIPVFGLFAAEADLATIDNADELIALAEKANADENYRKGETVTVTADIDMAGKAWKPIKVLNFVLDFQGHTVSNLKVTVTAADMHNDWHSNTLGLIASFVAGGRGVKNLKLKDSSLTVDAADKTIEVGGVIGKSDRGFVNNITMENVTITSNAAGSVGTLAGCGMWNYNGAEDNLVANLKATINAPKANVGVLFGHAHDGDTNYTLTDIDVELKVPASANAVKKDAYIGGGDTDGVTVTDAKVTIDSTGNEAIELDTIDTADEYIRFVNKVNETGRGYRKGQTILVTADLDFKGKTVPVIKDMVFTLDFQNHTVSNLVIVADNASGDFGLIANKVGNDGVNGVIKNVVLKNCSLTVNVAEGQTVQVGGVVGYCDRANVESATLQNVTVKVNGAGVVGGVIGAKGWKGPGNITATVKDTVIDAPNATVGLVIGKQYNWGGNEDSAPVNVKGANVSATVTASNEVTEATLIGEIGVTGTVTIPDTGVTVTLVDNAKGYDKDWTPDQTPVDPPVDPPQTEDPVDPPKTEDPVDPPVDPPKTEDPVDPPVDPPKTEDPVDPPVTDKPADNTTKAPDNTEAPDNGTPNQGGTDEPAGEDEDGSILPIVIGAVAAAVVVAVVVIVIVKKKKS